MESGADLSAAGTHSGALLRESGVSAREATALGSRSGWEREKERERERWRSSYENSRGPVEKKVMSACPGARAWAGSDGGKQCPSLFSAVVTSHTTAF